MCNRLHLDGNRLPVTDFEKINYQKVTILKVTCFWKVFQKSQLLKWLVFKRVTIFKMWLFLKKLPRVTNFNLSHQMIINMWPWHEFQTTKTDSFHSKKIDFFLWSTNFFHRVFVQYFLFQEKFIVQKLVLLFFFIHFFLLSKDSKD